MDEWNRLKDLCEACGFPEPNLVMKMWVTIVEIPGRYNRCHQDVATSVQMCINYCEDYLNEQC